MSHDLVKRKTSLTAAELELQKYTSFVSNKYNLTHAELLSILVSINRKYSEQKQSELELKLRNAK